jgi:hypothetical protein
VSLSDSPPDRSDGAARSLAIDLEGLIWALNSRDPIGESSHWLHLESGELLFLAGPDAAGAEDPRDSDRWLCVEPIESSQAFEIMEDFAEQCGDARLARALRHSGKHCSNASPSATSRTRWPRTRRSVRHASPLSGRRWR